MTANRRTTVLIVSAVVFTMLVLGMITTQLCATAFATENTATVMTGKVTMADIDSALATGPVFIEFESAECGYCKQQRPISEGVMENYPGKVAFFFVDTAESRDLARTFQVTGVPQINVIAKKADGGYTYINRNGDPASSVAGSKIVGLTERDTLRTVIDAAVNLRG